MSASRNRNDTQPRVYGLRPACTSTPTANDAQDSETARASARAGHRAQRGDKNVFVGGPTSRPSSLPRAHGSGRGRGEGDHVKEAYTACHDPGPEGPCLRPALIIDRIMAARE